MNGKRIVSDAKKPLSINIGPEDAKGAVCKDGRNCVVAKAFNSRLGEFLEGVEVGISITKVFTTDHRVIRYATPNKLRPAIREFDKTGKWNLEAGEYTFNPPSATAKLGGRPSRWHKHKHIVSRGGQDMFRARAVPTRRISRISDFVSV